MKTQFAILFVLAATAVTAAVSFGEDKPAPLQSIAKSAQADLAAATKQLTELRDQIAAEKVPLAQKLAALEEQLTQRRREQDRVQRLADSGAIELATFKSEQKTRQDEIEYVGNLLDEYARSYETKASVNDLQAVGDLLTAAKQATENTTLSRDDRLGRQFAFVDLTCSRLLESIGGMTYPGVVVGPDGSVESGNFATFGPVALFTATNGSLSGVVIPQPGSTKPLVRPLEGSLQTGLAALAAKGKGALPLDPSRGGALKALVKKFDIREVFKKGGPIMWPLLCAASLSILTVVERLIFLLLEQSRRDPKKLELFFDAVTEGDHERARKLAARSRYFVLRALVYALEHHERSITNALLYSQSREMKRYGRGIPVLDTVITLAPLLGLLGTVTGMMGSFSLIGGDLSSPGAITGGIAEALIATAFGLGIAITSLIPFNILNAHMENARQEMQSAATQFELLVNRPASIVEAVARASHH